MASSSSSSGPSAAADSSDKRLLGRPGQLLGSRGLERAPRSRAGIERERGGALEERGGRRQPAARLRAPGRALQLVGDVLVGAERGLGAVPGATIGIERRHRWPRPAPDARLADPRPAPPGRSPSAGADGGTRPAPPSSSRPSPTAGAIASIGEPELRRRSPQQRRLAGRLGRGQQQQPLRGGRQLLDAAPEARLDPALQRQLAAEGRSRRPAPRATTSRGSSSSASGLPRASARIRAAHALVQRRADDRREQLARMRVRQARRAATPAAGPARRARAAHGPRTRARPTRPSGAAPRTRAPARTTDRATGRRRPGTAAAVPRPPRTAG